MKLEHGAVSHSEYFNRSSWEWGEYPRHQQSDRRVCYAVSHMFINNKLYEICDVAVSIQNSLAQIPKWIKFGIKTNFR